MADGNGSGAAATAPTLNAMVQYTKDFSFENPNAPRSLGPQPKAPNISIQVNVNARQIAEADYEVELLLEGAAGEGNDTLFKFELNYAGIFPCAQHSRERHAAGRHDRMPAAAVPIRPANRCRCGAQRRLPAALHRPNRFRRPLPPADGADRTDPDRTSVIPKSCRLFGQDHAQENLEHDLSESRSILLPISAGSGARSPCRRASRQRRRARPIPSRR